MDTDLIKLVNKLQDTFSNLGGELDMPQLVVVGSQSAGKSSVLETIVGKDFLPRGSGIVTRRPLILQLIHSDGEEEWGQFLHVDKRFTDFAEIRKEIEQETFRVAGQNKGISKLPITLTVHSPNVLDLTLVDLPGLTKIPVGDQPSDIERQIRSLVVDYISKPNSVILAVSPANVDLANSDSLKLARAVDPQGRRTIGVLTKLDLMDAGTNAIDILTGRVYPLKLGFIGVVNRSQADINSGKSMSDALANEEEYFKTHPAYRNIAHKNGTRYLARTLNRVLMDHIREKLPDMKARLNTLMGQAEQELASFGDEAVFGDKNQQGALILRLMTNFAREFVASIEGTNVDISTKELSGGARIYYIFHDIFGGALASIDPSQNLDMQDIRTAIRNSTGPRPSLFVPEVAFDLLVKPQIRLLESPSLRCVEMLQRFPALHARMIQVVSDLLRERLGPTSDYAQSLISIQTAYINTNHPVFRSLQSQPQMYAAPQPRPQSVTLPQHAPSEDGDEAVSTTSDADSTGTTGGSGATRSVSSTVHDRTRPAAASTTTLVERKSISVAKASSRPHSTGGPMPGGSRHSSGGVGAGGSARDTFLNYFFGQNGPGPVMDANMDRPHSQPSGAMTPIVRDTAGLPNGTAMVNGTRQPNSVFDMKSLGRHIEAVPSNAHSLSLKEEAENNMIRSLITMYFDIVRQTIQDLVPKAIMHFLVNHASREVQNRLVQSLYKPDLFSEMLNEDPSLASERARVKALLSAYKEAFRTLSDVSVGGGF
ncbi:hypothetical protein FISHEDRAFT_36290 [Fistulina hepatica ATCC 64428]|uniref:Dynamin protein dnm1 n=1 Tax=Fistulina hepatica ATCC 64428 TaxID=1128425 RepID=A0A0D7AM93_9AGAR|nr:hypothetical protein FISHEDRAFT_36290 [Fistulina hepatica ATCC 64428]